MQDVRIFRQARQPSVAQAGAYARLARSSTGSDPTPAPSHLSQQTRREVHSAELQSRTTAGGLLRLSAREAQVMPIAQPAQDSKSNETAPQRNRFGSLGTTARTSRPPRCDCGSQKVATAAVSLPQRENALGIDAVKSAKAR